MFLRAVLSIILLLMSPIIIISNLLILSTWFRFKRLRTPSNFLVISLSSADLGFGLVLPAAVAVDLTLQHQQIQEATTDANANVFSDNDNDRTSLFGFGRMKDDLITTTVRTLIRNVTTSTYSPVANAGGGGTSNEWAVNAGTYGYGHGSSDSSGTNNAINLAPGGSNEHFDQQNETFINVDINGGCDDTLCMTHFIILLIFCSAAILSMTAIALDRLMSVAQPLRYNHFVTMSHVQKFVSCYWIYSALLCSAVPFMAPFYKSNPEAHILLMSVCVYVPCAILTSLSYLYIYLIARSHARAIYSVEISLNNGGLLEVSDTSASTSSHPRYGLTLAGIVSAFILCWSPIQICAFGDVIMGGQTLGDQYNWRILLATPVVFSCTMNPYLYAYRSSEIRIAVIRTVDTIVTKITGRPPKIPIFIQDKGDLTSCASNIRLLGVSPTPTQTSIQCSGEGLNAATTLTATPTPETNQNHLNLFLGDYHVTTL